MPTQFEPHTWNQLCELKMLKWIINFKRLFFMETTWKTNGKFIFPHDIKWSDRNHSYTNLVFQLLLIIMHTNSMNQKEKRIAMEWIGGNKKETKKKIEREREKRTTASRFSDMVIVLWQMAWCLCILYSIL